ncbi:MAG: FHA domain-containing protein [Deltaproteobacteria bacterium]|nr:FHA domain-containing protein [Deltaproteobacteria bacterium]
MASDPVLKVELTLKDRVIDTYTFAQAEVVIGRDPEADITIDNTGISRFHTRIELNAGGTYILKDLGSTNGTYLNDQQINEEPLRSNDIITIGKFILKVNILKHETPARVSRSQAPPSDDIDGTTVLSKEQMEKMMANIKKPATPGKAGAAGSNAQPAGISMGVLAAIGGVVFVAILAIAWFVIM